MIFIYYLILGLVYSTVGFFVIRWLMRVPRKGKYKALVAVIGIVVLLLIPTWDEIGGRIYLRHLCATQAGVKIYKTIELPAKYWDESGEPMFFNQYGYLDHDFWVKELDESGGRIERYSSIFSIDKDTSPVKERLGQKVLAEVTTFRFWGGWIRRNFSPNNVADSCVFISKPEFSREFYGQLFEPEPSQE
ncbi:hypothetical protein [Desulfuromonas thiophila]|uniref:hypothetical protein n=1 Tax=Desulfuromonas thiophila TaxID=57664 RepID=UPI00115FA5ED|nr:hypothetical protein [Desulfuromonas thiophila]